MKKAVLIVDDDANLRELLAGVCVSAGLEVETAENGEEGFGKVRSRAFDLIFADIKMPKMDGIQMAEAIFQIKPKQQIVLMSGTMNEREIEAHFHGKVLFLSKPFKVSTVKKILSSLV